MAIATLLISTISLGITKKVGDGPIFLTINNKTDKNWRLRFVRAGSERIVNVESKLSGTEEKEVSTKLKEYPISFEALKAHDRIELQGIPMAESILQKWYGNSPLIFRNGNLTVNIENPETDKSSLFIEIRKNSMAHRYSVLLRQYGQALVTPENEIDLQIPEKDIHKANIMINVTLDENLEKSTIDATASY